jgi:TIR domain
MSDFFISHSHVDKAIARRVARRLHAYGVEAWLDERELRLGDALGATIEQHIQNSMTMLVITTAAATKSTWVEKELAFATSLEPARPICPLFVEDVRNHPLFADHLGLNVMDPHQFERGVLRLAETVAGLPLPPPLPDRLKEDLDIIGKEEPSLSLLVHDCLAGEGLALNHLDSVAQVSFHSLDYALNALYDLARDEQQHRTAHAAASLFARRGVGTYALERYVAAGGEAEVLQSAVATQLNRSDFDAALGLLSLCSPPNDQALAGFINHNAHLMTNAHHDAVVRLVTQPNRGPKGFTVDAAFSALRHLPESGDLRRLWERWISNGRFDGLTEDDAIPDTLAYYLGEALREDISDMDGIIRTFLAHVKTLARSTDRTNVETAVDHLAAAANRQSPLLEQVSEQCTSALGAAEWDGWAHAQEMGIYVRAHVTAAHGDLDWSSAFADYERSWDAVQRVNELRSRYRDPQQGGSRC